MWQVQSSTENDQFAMFQNIGSAVKPYRKILQQGACICCKIKEYTSVKHLSQISPLTRMPLSHEYRVEQCGRTQKLRGPGGEGAVCEFCNRYFPSEKKSNKFTHPPPPHSGPGGRQINLSGWMKNAEKCKNITLTIVFHRNGFNFNVGFKKS